MYAIYFFTLSICFVACLQQFSWAQAVLAPICSRPQWAHSVLISQLPKTDFCWFKRPLKILCINSRSRPPRCVSCVMNKYLSIVILSQSDFVFRSNYILDSFCNTSKCTVTTPLKKWKLPKLNLNLDRINCKVRYLFIKIAFKKWPIYHSRECMFSTNSHIILNSHLLLLQ